MGHKGIQNDAMSLIGSKFGRITIRQLSQKKNKKGKNVTYALCDCECGKSKEVQIWQAKENKIGFRGCYCAKHRTHGQATGISTVEYNTWMSIKARCYNANYKDYARYGGRGISVYPEWRESFEAFFAFMGKRPPDKHSIDRINNDGNYEPGNVRWATIKEQNVNKPETIKLVWQGKIMTVSELSKLSGICTGAIRLRFHKGYSIDRILMPNNRCKIVRLKKHKIILASNPE